MQGGESGNAAGAAGLAGADAVGLFDLTHSESGRARRERAPRGWVRLLPPPAALALTAETARAVRPGGLWCFGRYWLPTTLLLSPPVPAAAAAGPPMVSRLPFLTVASPLAGARLRCTRAAALGTVPADALISGAAGALTTEHYALVAAADGTALSSAPSSDAAAAGGVRAWVSEASPLPHVTPATAPALTDYLTRLDMMANKARAHLSRSLWLKLTALGLAHDLPLPGRAVSATASAAGAAGNARAGQGPAREGGGVGSAMAAAVEAGVAQAAAATRNTTNTTLLAGKPHASDADASSADDCHSNSSDSNNNVRRSNYGSGVLSPELPGVSDAAVAAAAADAVAAQGRAVKAWLASVVAAPTVAASAPVPAAQPREEPKGRRAALSAADAAQHLRYRPPSSATANSTATSAAGLLASAAAAVPTVVAKHVAGPVLVSVSNAIRNTTVLLLNAGGGAAHVNGHGHHHGHSHHHAHYVAQSSVLSAHIGETVAAVAPALLPVYAYWAREVAFHTHCVASSGASLLRGLPSGLGWPRAAFPPLQHLGDRRPGVALADSWEAFAPSQASAVLKNAHTNLAQAASAAGDLPAAELHSALACALTAWLPQVGEEAAAQRLQQ